MIRGRLEAYADDLFASLQRADQRGGHQRRLDRRHAAPRVLVVQRPSRVAITPPVAHGERATYRSGKRVGSSRVVVEATLQAA
jgi:hypothetical protein